MKEKVSETITKTRVPIGSTCVRCSAKRGEEGICEAWGKHYDRHFYNKVSMLETKVVTIYLEK